MMNMHRKLTVKGAVIVGNTLYKHFFFFYSIMILLEYFLLSYFTKIRERCNDVQPHSLPLEVATLHKIADIVDVIPTKQFSD